MADAPLLEIRDLAVSRQSAQSLEPVQVLHAVSLTIRVGEVHTLVGPHGAGKSTLAASLLGSPDLCVTEGSICFQGDDITDWSPDVRAKAGLFLGFQKPEEIPGVSVLNFLNQALNVRKGVEMSVVDFRKSLLARMKGLGIEPAFIDRHVNERFTPAEQYRSEILQMAILEPLMAVLDETESGPASDAAAILAKGVNAVRGQRPEMATLTITRDCSQQGLIGQLQPDHVHLMVDGRIVTSGGPELCNEA